MPELPEVEVVKQSLVKKIQHRKIIKIIIKNRNLRFKIPTKFEEVLKNKVIKKVSRFSKYLILNFSDGSFCLIHLGMSGTIHLIDKNNLNKFTNTSFYNSCLLYTSDAADDSLRVDLGGRRIIKKIIFL